MKKLNVAIIGQGRSGRNIHGNFLKKDEAKEMFTVVAVVELDELRRNRAAEEYGCDVYADYSELYGRTDIDLVINCTMSHSHPQVTIDLLEHGFNVVCEKPAARTVEQFDAMVAAAEKSGKYFNIFQQSRFAPYYQKVKEVLDSGVLGEIFEVDISFSGFSRRWDWQTLQCFGAGNLYNTGPHPLDQALDILDMRDDMPNVFCKMGSANAFGDAEDYVKLILTAPGKPLIDLAISSCDAYPNCTYKVHARNGSLKATMGTVEWKYFDPAEAEKREVIPTPLADADGFPIYCSETLPWKEEKAEMDPAGPFNAAVYSYYKMTYEHLVNGRPTEITPKQVRQQIAVIEEAHRQNPMQQRYDFVK